MKKLLLGVLQTALSPLAVAGGYYVINGLALPTAPYVFACVLGGLSLSFSFVIGILLIIRGYQELGTFKGWG